MDHARIEAALSEFCSFLKDNESKLRAFVDIGAMNFDSWLLLELLWAVAVVVFEE